MAVPVRLIADSPSDGYIRLRFAQGERTMKTSGNHDLAAVLLHYPCQGQLMKGHGEPTKFELMVKELNDELQGFNELIEKWCS